MIHADDGILFNTKKMSYQGMKRHEGNLSAYYQVKEVNLKRLHTVWFQHSGGNKKISDCQKLGVRGQWERWIDGNRGFLGEWKYYVWYHNNDTCHYVFAQHQDWITNHGPLWWGMWIMQEVMHIWRQGAYWKSLYPMPNFIMNLKLP